MASKNLTEALEAIKLGKADSRKIQSNITYSELLPYLFGSVSSQPKIQKKYLSEQQRDSAIYLGFDENEVRRILDSGEYIRVHGANASPGASQGKVVYTPKTFSEYRGEKNIVYLMIYQTPSDVQFVTLSCGVIATTGGATSHAAVTGRQFGIPTVTGCNDIKFDMEKNVFFINEHIIKEGDDVLVDGTHGNVYFFLNKKLDKIFTTVKLIDENTLEVISNFIYTCIQNHEIYPFGLDLGYISMILKMRNAKSLAEIAALSPDFDYLETFQQNSILWKLLLPQLRTLCAQIRTLIQIESGNQSAIKKDILRILSRINDMANKSVDYRHHMILLHNVLKHIDLLIYNYKYDENRHRNVAFPKILVVEDEPYLIAETIQRLEDELNADLTIISNAQDAIEIIRSNTILDLAIIDLMIPSDKNESLELDPYQGIKVSEFLKETKGDTFPIMFLTSVRDTGVLGKLLNSTVIRVINKPSLTSSIVDTVKDMLGNTNLADVNLLKSEIQRRKLEIQSPDPNTRIRALWALSQYRNHDGEIIHLLQTIMDKDSSEEVRIAVKRILSQPFLLKDEKFAYSKKDGITPESKSVIIQGNVQNSIIILGDENFVQGDFRDEIEK